VHGWKRQWTDINKYSANVAEQWMETHLLQSTKVYFNCHDIMECQTQSNSLRIVRMPAIYNNLLQYWQQRLHYWCYLPNNFGSCHIFPILHNGARDHRCPPQTAPFLCAWIRAHMLNDVKHGSVSDVYCRPYLKQHLDLMGHLCQAPTDTQTILHYANIQHNFNQII